MDERNQAEIQAAREEEEKYAESINEFCRKFSQELAGKTFVVHYVGMGEVSEEPIERTIIFPDNPLRGYDEIALYDQSHPFNKTDPFTNGDKLPFSNVASIPELYPIATKILDSMEIEKKFKDRIKEKFSPKTRFW